MRHRAAINAEKIDEFTRLILHAAHRVAILRSAATSSGSSSRCEPRSPMSAYRWPTSAVSRRLVNRADESIDGSLAMFTAFSCASWQSA